MKLPPVDTYRAPFIQPFGHMVMQAALADDALVRLCAEIPATFAEEEVDYGASAHELRNWNEKSQAFIQSRIAKIDDLELRAQATEVVERFGSLRNQRHRAVHDAVDVGVYGGNTSYYALPLAVSYLRDGRTTRQELAEVTPESIADLACQLYELQCDIRLISDILKRRLPRHYL